MNARRGRTHPPAAESAGGEDEARLYGRALRLLAVHDRTEADLRGRLGRHGDEASVERVIGRLKAQRYVDDGRFAEVFTQREALERGAGAHLVRAALRAHGVIGEIAEEQVRRAAAAERDTALAVARRAMRRLGGLDEAVAVRRLAGQLARRGYRAAVVYEVVREVVRAGGSVGEEAEGALDGLAAQVDADPGLEPEPDGGA